MAQTEAGKILIVDDEEAVRFFIADSLIQAGWEVTEAASGEMALLALEKTAYDIVLLDLRMPGLDGVAVMRQIKARWPQTLIIILTAYASVDSAVAALRLGAFDYLHKPCDAQDIIACVQRALHKKRTTAVSPPPAAPPDQAPLKKVQTGDLTIDLGSRTLYLSAQPLSLTPTEYKLIALLARHPGHPVALTQLIQEGLGYSPEDGSAQETLRVHISRLRRKLGAGYILTVRGGGYVLANITASP